MQLAAVEAAARGPGTGWPADTAVLGQAVKGPGLTVTGTHLATAVVREHYSSLALSADALLLCVGRHVLDLSRSCDVLPPSTSTASSARGPGAVVPAALGRIHHSNTVSACAFEGNHLLCAALTLLPAQHVAALAGGGGPQHRQAVPSAAAAAAAAQHAYLNLSPRQAPLVDRPRLGAPASYVNLNGRRHSLDLGALLSPRPTSLLTNAHLYNVNNADASSSDSPSALKRPASPSPLDVVAARIASLSYLYAQPQP